MKNSEIASYVAGIGATEDIDSSGEIIEIAGIDHSSLCRDGRVKWEHLGKIGQLRYHYCDENARFVAQGENAMLNWLKPEIVESNVFQLEPNRNFYESAVTKTEDLPW